MAQQPKTQTVLSDWKGQHSDPSPHAAPDASGRVQENLGVYRAGVMESRAGLIVIRYDN